jgi:primosomal replication protein N
VNQLTIVAKLIEKAAVRYTPAGIPIANGVLLHSSQQKEAGLSRLVEVELVALAAGEQSKIVSDLPLDVEFCFSGFLARKNRNSKSLVFHITEVGTHLLD